jgi:uncharacterized protein (DUF1015 family)
MKNFDIEVFVKDLDKLFNDMQDKAIAGSENVATASWVIKQQQSEIEALKNILSEIDRQVFNIELRDDGTMTPVIRMEKP